MHSPKKKATRMPSVKAEMRVLFSRFRDSILVISYREPGNPSIQKIEELLQQYKSDIRISRTEYKHKLNRKNGRDMREVLMIAK